MVIFFWSFWSYRHSNANQARSPPHPCSYSPWAQPIFRLHSCGPSGWLRPSRSFNLEPPLRDFPFTSTTVNFRLSHPRQLVFRLILFSYAFFFFFFIMTVGDMPHGVENLFLACAHHRSSRQARLFDGLTHQIMELRGRSTASAENDRNKL